MKLRSLSLVILAFTLALSACSSSEEVSTKKPVSGDTNDQETTVPVATLVTITPATAEVNVGESQTFTATVSGPDDKAVTWSVEQENGGTITEAGTYTAPDEAGTFHVVATSVYDTSRSARATVTVLPADIPVVSVTISPEAAEIRVNETQQFTATVHGSENTDVTWEASGGEVDANGLFTAPSESGTFSVTARSVADDTKTAQATVTVLAVRVEISPTSVTLLTGETQQFTATVFHADATEVTWGTTGEVSLITADGLFTAPDDPGVFEITATSVEDPTKSATATVTVNEVVVTLDPASAITIAHGEVTFTATVAGTENQVVTWCVVGDDDLCTGLPEYGTLTSYGMGTTYTAPATHGTYIVRAIPDARPANFQEAIIEVIEPYLVVTPAYTTTITEATQQFTADFVGVEPDTITWSVNAPLENGGVIDAAGEYTAPVTPGTYVIVASSYGDTVTGYATITIVEGYVVTVSPKTVALAWGMSQQFTAEVVGDDLDGVDWSRDGDGELTADGLYTAAEEIGQFTITAASQLDLTVTDTATVTVCEAFVPIISYRAPDDTVVAPGEFQFLASDDDSLQAILLGEAIGMDGWDYPLYGVTWVTRRAADGTLGETFALEYGEDGLAAGYEVYDNMGVLDRYARYALTVDGYPAEVTYYNADATVIGYDEYQYHEGVLVLINFLDAALEYRSPAYRQFSYGVDEVVSEAFRFAGPNLRQVDERVYTFEDGVMIRRDLTPYAGNNARQDADMVTTTYLYNEAGDLTGLEKSGARTLATATAESCPW